jgi:transposase
MTIYCGVDFHARVQTVSYCDSQQGEIHTIDLHHQEDDLRSFYSQFKGDVIVGLEASGYSPWFEQMLEELGHQVWIGDAAQIRRLAKRRQKNDHRDAELILDLLVNGGFPRLHRPSAESREVLNQPRYRNRLVKIRTMTKNNLRALSIRAGLTAKSTLITRGGRDKLKALPMSQSASLQREHWFELLKGLNDKIAEVDDWLKQQAKANQRVTLLQTHPGIGLLTSLGLAHMLDPVSRFSNSRKVTAYLGLDPMESSSGEKKRMLSISKAWSRLLRYLIIEAAHTAVKYDAKLKRFYMRLSRSKGKHKAIVAVGRKLLVRSYIMLRDGIDYEEFLRRGVEARPARY